MRALRQAFSLTGPDTSGAVGQGVVSGAEFLRKADARGEGGQQSHMVAVTAGAAGGDNPVAVGRA